jgi:hypothetical protein
VFRGNSLGYVWISGQTRPCLELGTGHDLYYLPLYVFLLFPGIAGVLIGSRTDGSAVLSRPGLIAGVALVILWLGTIGTDRAPLGALLGCAQ